LPKTDNDLGLQMFLVKRMCMKILAFDESGINTRVHV